MSALFVDFRLQVITIHRLFHTLRLSLIFYNLCHKELWFHNNILLVMITFYIVVINFYRLQKRSWWVLMTIRRWFSQRMLSNSTWGAMSASCYQGSKTYYRLFIKTSRRSESRLVNIMSSYGWLWDKVNINNIVRMKTGIDILERTFLRSESRLMSIRSMDDKIHR